MDKFVKAQRSGITLVETLVAIGIIGILLAILLPTVQIAREAGRKAACQNNLRQLALAIQEHHAARGEVPNLYNVNENNQHGLYAFHHGGANIALADGSVRLLAGSTDVEIVRAFITRSGSEAVALN